MQFLGKEITEYLAKFFIGHVRKWEKEEEYGSTIPMKVKRRLNEKDLREVAVYMLEHGIGDNGAKRKEKAKTLEGVAING